MDNLIKNLWEKFQKKLKRKEYHRKEYHMCDVYIISWNETLN